VAPVPGLPRSARLAAWGGGLLRGTVGAEAALDAIRRGEHHEAVDADGTSPLAVALGLLRREGVTGLALVLPVPGDPCGLAGPPETNAEAVAAGEAVLAVGDGTAYALVPRVEIRGSSLVAVAWRRLPAEPPRTSAVPQLSEADRELKEVLSEATEELVRLDVARWRPEVAEALSSLREGAGAEPLPGDYPARAREVLARAQLLAGVAALAGEDPGAAVSAGQMGLRSAALTRLGTAARRAVVAAVNAPLEPAR